MAMFLCYVFIGSFVLLLIFGIISIIKEEKKGRKNGK